MIDILLFVVATTIAAKIGLLFSSWVVFFVVWVAGYFLLFGLYMVMAPGLKLPIPKQPLFARVFGWFILLWP